MSEVKKFVLVPKELWESRKRKLLEPSCEIYKKEETVFPVIKKAKEEVSSEKTDRPPKEIKKDLEFHYKNNPETLKTLKEIYKNKRLKMSLSNTIIVDNVDTGVDIKTFLHSIKLKNAPVDPNYIIILNLKLILILILKF